MKENKVGSTVISSYDYGVNVYGQLTGVAQAGTAFSSSRSHDWGYNAKGEVVTADSSISGFDRAYLYDGLGNRKKSANSLTLPSSDNYTTNALNQYTAVGSISPTYDDDGNATAYPVPVYPSANSTLVWDGENRLISATVNSVTTTYLYDSHSRRIAKVPASDSATLYVYDGWDCVAEYTGTTLSKTRTWGKDLSASLRGAGGVGGLLSEKQGGTYYYPTYDGNGNVSEYMTSSGSITAHFEYDPFGNPTVDTDTSGQFAYRFSTKPLDFETGLYYYGYRFYDPATERWISRDPIGERGGKNLYAFTRNASTTIVDIDGRQLYPGQPDEDVFKFPVPDNFGFDNPPIVDPPALSPPDDLPKSNGIVGKYICRRRRGYDGSSTEGYGGEIYGGGPVCCLDGGCSYQCTPIEGGSLIQKVKSSNLNLRFAE